MARHLFGGSPADFAMERVGDQLVLRPGSQGTVWDSRVGGVQITDLTDLQLNPTTTVTADADGGAAFLGPDDDTITYLYVDFGYGRRYILTATDLGKTLNDFIARGGLPDGWAKLDSSGRLTVSQLPAQQDWVATKGAVIRMPSGAVSEVVWRAPRDCTITAVRGYRAGGTGATINAAKNGLDILVTDLSLSTAATWLSGPTLQNQAVLAGDSVSVALRSVAGSPSAVTIQIDVQEA
ncbi:hypothetical protein [Streptomyces sp. SID8352]|uniref:hypothetical protein n=1 Tax=Streptomyces sp. SID8352 TaxID=2690338 RepID=UPI00136A7B89|nr:hypothetical protein [Streptomyces sp. SID8352]MYU24641.1 hypothetical protein [Streptomyces sp. SID8352]